MYVISYVYINNQRIGIDHMLITNFIMRLLQHLDGYVLMLSSSTSDTHRCICSRPTATVSANLASLLSLNFGMNRVIIARRLLVWAERLGTNMTSVEWIVINNLLDSAVVNAVQSKQYKECWLNCTALKSAESTWFFWSTANGLILYPDIPYNLRRKLNQV